MQQRLQGRQGAVGGGHHAEAGEGRLGRHVRHRHPPAPPLAPGVLPLQEGTRPEARAASLWPHTAAPRRSHMNKGGAPVSEGFGFAVLMLRISSCTW